MKTFIDRFSYIFGPGSSTRRPSSSSPHAWWARKDVLKYLDSVASICGFDVARTGIVMLLTPSKRQTQGNDQKLDEAAQGFFRAPEERRARRPELRSVIIFHAQRVSFDELADSAPTDYDYWKDRG